MLEELELVPEPDYRHKIIGIILNVHDGLENVKDYLVRYVIGLESDDFAFLHQDNEDVKLEPPAAIVGKISDYRPNRKFDFPRAIRSCFDFMSKQQVLTDRQLLCIFDRLDPIQVTKSKQLLARNQLVGADCSVEVVTIGFHCDIETAHFVNAEELNGKYN